MNESRDADLSEYFPRAEEIEFVFTKLVKGRRYVEMQKCGDEEGLYFCTIRLVDRDSPSITEYSFVRKGLYPETGCLETYFFVAFYVISGNEEIPAGGHNVARLDKDLGVLGIIVGVWYVLTCVCYFFERSSA